MRIVFLAVEDEYAGEMQRYLFERHPEWIVGSVISSRRIYGKSNFKAALFLPAHSGWTYFVSMIWTKIISRFISRCPGVTPRILARQYHVPIFLSANINDDLSRQRLSEWEPDLIISTNFSHFVGRRARRIAKIGAWNLHKSYLPDNRGMAPSFYALLNGEEWSGATLHIMDNGFDTGDIIEQVRVPIRDGDTVFDLNFRTAREGGKMLLDFINRFDPINFSAKPQPAGNCPANSYPSRKAVQAFRRKKLKFGPQVQRRHYHE